MTKLLQDNYFILTGAMGAGKSTILKELRKLGMICIDEPARQILAEQRNVQGDGVPDKDQKLFTDLLLSRSIYQFKQMQERKGPVIYDRGIADNICYAQLFDLDTQITHNAAREYHYNKLVFFLPGWKEIYENDDERKMTFDQANQFGHNIKTIYAELGYDVVDVPIGSPSSRAEFISSAVVKTLSIESIEPKLVDDQKLKTIMDELTEQEPIFHHPEYGTTREALDNMLADTFWEVGASGRRYSREYAIDTLIQRYQNPEEDNWDTTDFHCLEIAENHYLLTYTLIQGMRVTRRSTIWRRINQTWKIVYHQGTIVEDL